MAKISTIKTAGNMLVYIIGAIFLMGMLIVILRGSFQEGIGIDAEKNALRAGEVMRYGAELEKSGPLYNLERFFRKRYSFQPSDRKRKLYGLWPYLQHTCKAGFFPQGGGAVWRNPPTGSQVIAAPWVFSANNAAVQIGSTCATPACSDLIVVLPNVTKELCVQVNRAKSIVNPAGNPPREVDGINLAVLFTAGVFGYSATLDTTGAHTSAHPEGCFEGNGGDTVAGSYYYYRVLLAR